MNLGALRIEKRLKQRRWLMVAVPLGSLVVAHIAIALLLLATGHPPITTLRRLFDAAYLADGALTNTLIASTPLAFTGLAAAVAFRMRLFNIGAEGQLYFGAIGAAGMGLLLAGQSTTVLIVAMVAGGAVLGAAWGAIPGLLRAFLRTNEIITSLMLNYVAALVLNYLIFDSLSYWRDTSPQALVFPQGKVLVDAATWPVTTIGSVAIPLGFVLAAVVRGRDLGTQLPHALRLRGAGDRRLSARGAIRRHADTPQDRRRDGALGRDRGHRRREPDRQLRTRSTPAAFSSRTTATRASSSLRSRATTRSPWCSWRSCSAGSRTPATRCRAPTSRPASWA